MSPNGSSKYGRGLTFAGGIAASLTTAGSDDASRSGSGAGVGAVTRDGIASGVSERWFTNTAYMIASMPIVARAATTWTPPLDSNGGGT